MWQEGQVIEHQSATIFQKAEGILYCTNQNVAWVPSGSSAPTLLIQILHIKNQQVSTQESSRVKLRLLIKTDSGQDSAYTFLWKETDKNLAKNDRDSFKNILAIRMSRARSSQAQKNFALSPPATAEHPNKKAKIEYSVQSKVSAEDLKIRQLILSKNPELSHLHKTLVVSGIMLEETFWISRKHLIKEYTFENQIQKGEDSSLLEFAPTIQDNGNFKYTITPELARAIFKTYPQIKQAYIDNVPHKVSEGMFWKRFLSSQFFNRNTSKTIKVAKDDIFDKAMDEEDKFLSGGAIVDSDQLIPLFDLTRTEQDSVETGNSSDITMKPGLNPDNISIIRRFNRYSEQILSTTTEPSQKSVSEQNKIELCNSIIITDLQATNENNEVLLNLKDTDRYFANSKDTEDDQLLDKKSLERILERAKLDVSEIHGRISIGAESHILGKVMRRISEMLHKERNEVLDAKKKVGLLKASDNKQKITQLYAESYELSRFMYSLLKPPLQQLKAKKAAEIDLALAKYVEKLDKFIDGLDTDQKQIISAISERVRVVVSGAQQAYIEFQQIANAMD